MTPLVHETRIDERLENEPDAAELESIAQVLNSGFDPHEKTFRAYYARFLPANRGARILDMGCGYGRFMYFLQRDGYSDVSGVDKNAHCVGAARRLGTRQVSHQDIMTYLADRRNEFDCITALDVLEHFEKPRIIPLLDAVLSALKPTGIFILQVPNGSSPFSNGIRYGDFTHELAFTEGSITRLLHATGFGAVDVYAAGPVVHGFFSAGRWVIWTVMQAVMRLYLLAETGSGRYILSRNLIAVARRGEKL